MLFSLINCHVHSPMVAFRGLAEDLSLDIWLKEHIWPMEKENVNPDFVYKNAKIAIREMQKNGIKAFADMYFFEDKIARAAEELGMHAVIGEGILDFPTPGAKSANEALEITEKLILKYKGNPYISVAVAPHSIYTVSKNNLIKAKGLAEKYQTLYHIHLAETKLEFDNCLKTNGVTPVEYLERLGILDDKTLLAHCVWVADGDIEILAKRRVKVAHCPLSNLKLGSGIAPISKMIEKGVTVALGTDGAASSNRLDIWEAGKFACLLQKGITNDPTRISAKEAVKMMTINGMKSLGIEKIEGKSISDIENQINSVEDWSCLYRLNINDLNKKNFFFGKIKDMRNGDMY